MDVIKNDIIKDTIYHSKIDNGPDVYVLVKKGYIKKQAMFATKFGSINMLLNDDGKIVKLPSGVAHFLEHKMFKQKDTDAMEQFTKMGAYSNAYTSFDHTAYWFWTTSNFEQNFKYLLHFVQNPYITAESVENEKGIIGQEIDMYLDEPYWQLYEKFYGTLFNKNNPLTLDIAGSHESISKIDVDLLYKTYKGYYNPDNMVVIVCGDVDPDEVLDWVVQEVDLNKKFDQPKVKLDMSNPENKTIIKNMSVSQTMYMFGCKDKNTDKYTLAQRYIALNIMLDCIIGKGSDLYNKLYEKGYITTEFEFSYDIEAGCGCIYFQGKNENYNVVMKEIIDKLQEVSKTGINKHEFDIIKKKHLGIMAKEYDSIDRISRSMISDYINGFSMFEKLEQIKNIDLDTTNKIIKECLDIENIGLSVICPIE